MADSSVLQSPAQPAQLMVLFGTKQDRWLIELAAALAELFPAAMVVLNTAEYGAELDVSEIENELLLWQRANAVSPAATAGFFAPDCLAAALKLTQIPRKMLGRAVIVAGNNAQPQAPETWPLVPETTVHLVNCHADQQAEWNRFLASAQPCGDWTLDHVGTDHGTVIQTILHQLTQYIPKHYWDDAQALRKSVH